MSDPLMDDDDYEEFLEREGLRPRSARRGRPTWVLVTGILLVAALVLSFVLI